MHDISMCINDQNCPTKRDCYRSQASGTKPASLMQAWGLFEPHKAEMCRGYWHIHERTKALRAALAKKEEKKP